MTSGAVSKERVVLAGVDGSAESLLAARWAARQAVLRNTELQLIHCYLEPYLGDGYVVSPEVGEQIEVAAQRVLDAAAEAVRGGQPDLPVRAALVYGDPRPTLLAASASAVLTVVGGKGRGRFAEVIVGSVALAVASHSRSPVAVVPSGVHLDSTAGPVLLGVCDTSDCEMAVGFAFEAAATAGSGVHAVLVIDEHLVPPFARGPARTGSELDQQQQDVLSGQLDRWQNKYPEVPVQTEIRRGRVATALLESGHQLPAGPPAMVVVGSRGRGGLTGMLLGSTGQALIAHSPWPVVVVRPDAT